MDKAKHFSYYDICIADFIHKLYSGEDECDCENSFHCVTPRNLSSFGISLVGECIPRRDFCNNINDCSDKSDEEPYRYDTPHY